MGPRCDARPDPFADQGQVAELHARAHVHQQIPDHRRGAEPDAEADEDLDHARRTRDQGRVPGQHRPDRHALPYRAQLRADLCRRPLQGLVAQRSCDANARRALATRRPRGGNPVAADSAMSLPSELAARDPDRPEVSVVVPVYNEEAGLAAFWARLAPVLDSLGRGAEVIFVDDGSSDGTLAQLMSLRHQDPRVRIVSLSRNFGKEIALTAGLDHADGNAVIPIDADLQHPPEVIAELVARWREGSDIVVALRRDRATDRPLRRAASSLFHSLFVRMTTVPVVRDAGDFRLMSRPVVDALRKLPERTRFMKGLYAWVGFRQTTVSYDIEPRLEG